MPDIIGIIDRNGAIRWKYSINVKCPGFDNCIVVV
jgi:hypothetical protein